MIKPRAIAGCAMIASIFCCSCHREQFIRFKKGLEYRIISIGEGDSIRPGETLKLHLKQVYHDSVLNDTRDSLPFYQVYDSLSLTPESWYIFGKLRKGDSAIFRSVGDSAFKKGIPPFAKKGEWLYTCLKVVDIFGVKQDFRDDLRKEMEKKRREYEQATH